MSKEKCKYKITHGEFCNGLEPRLEQEANSSNKGFSTVQTFNFETGQERCVGVRYRVKSKDKGLMLNVCPWCCSNLEWWKK